MKNYEMKVNLLRVVQNGSCYHCKRYVPVGEGQLDHILPKHRAKAARNPKWVDAAFNLRLMCPKCHIDHRPPGFSTWEIIKIDESLKTGNWFWISNEKLRHHIYVIIDALSRYKNP